MSLGVCGLAQASEIGSLPLRSQTQGLIGFTQSLCGWLVLFTIPYMINPDAGNLGGKAGYVVFGMGVIITLVLYLYCPEMKGLSYDEVQNFLEPEIDYYRLIIYFQQILVPENFRKLFRDIGKIRAGRMLVENPRRVRLLPL